MYVIRAYDDYGHFDWDIRAESEEIAIHIARRLSLSAGWIMSGFHRI